MNKLFILFLAFCLVSVHAFVKRDAPEAPKADDNVPKWFEEGKQTLGKIGDDLQKVFNPESIKEGLDKFTAGVKTAIDSLGKTEAPKA